jgi:hypothetical protein
MAIMSARKSDRIRKVSHFLLSESTIFKGKRKHNILIQQRLLCNVPLSFHHNLYCSYNIARLDPSPTQT